MTMMMTSPVSEEWPKLTGRQAPHNYSASPGDYSHGDKALTLAERAGTKAMPWQVDMVRGISATDAEGRWVHSDAVLLCPRQNGKSLILTVIVLYRLFVLGNSIIFTAQQWKTAEDIWKRTWAMVDRRKSLKRHVARKTCSQGRGTIELHNGASVTFTTRSADAGRGLSEVDLLIFDEAYNLTESEIAAVSFTQLAADDPQTIYTSSAVNRDQHANGEVLSSLRERGLRGDDPSLFFAEFMAPESMDRDDPDTWAYANPSYGVIMTEAKIRKLMRGMSTEAGRTSFDVEALGRGVWFEELEEAEFVPVLPDEVVRGAVDDSPARVGRSVLALDASPDGGTLAIAAAAKTGRGFHGTVGFHDAFSTDDAVEYIAERVAENDPVAVIIDPKSPADTLTIPLERAGVQVTRINFSQAKQAYGSFLTRIAERKWSIDDDPRVFDALSYAEARVMESGSMWDRYSGDVSVLVALNFALWGAEAFEPEDKPKQKTSIGAVSAAAVSSWQKLSF